MLGTQIVKPTTTTTLLPPSRSFCFSLPSLLAQQFPLGSLPVACYHKVLTDFLTVSFVITIEFRNLRTVTVPYQVELAVSLFQALL
jgi:hypothetical protein